MTDYIREKRLSTQSDLSTDNASCVVQFIDDWVDNTVICSVYIEENGCPNTVGKYLGDFLHGYIISNDFPENHLKQASGIGCLAAQFVAECKKKPGDVIIVDKNFLDSVKWIYIVSYLNSHIHVQVKMGNIEKFSGNIEEFIDYLSIYIDEVPTLKRLKPFNTFFTK